VTACGIPPAALALALAAILGAGCGGDDGDDTTAPATAAPGFPQELTEDQQAAVERFADCMRERGVELPQDGPPSSGPTPEMIEAVQACRDELPDDFELRGPPAAPPQ
jgi:hypothetical protein